MGSISAASPRVPR